MSAPLPPMKPKPVDFSPVSSSSTVMMNHEELRERIRASCTVSSFLAIYETPEFGGCLTRLRNAQLSKCNREIWSRKWALALSRHEEWACHLNEDRKTVTVYIQELCDRWNPYNKRMESSSSISSDEIITQLGDNKIRQMVKLCLVMDRAHTNQRGMHWYADRDSHIQFLQKQGVKRGRRRESKNAHTMNKRYLWLLQDDEFKPLVGLQTDRELQKWSRPEISPIRILAEYENSC